MAAFTPEAPQDQDITVRVAGFPGYIAGIQDAFDAGHEMVYPENLVNGAAKTDPHVARALGRQGVTVETFTVAVTLESGRDYDYPLDASARAVVPPGSKDLLKEAVGLAERSGDHLLGRHVILSAMQKGNTHVENALSSLNVDTARFGEDLKQPPVDPLEEATQGDSRLSTSLRGLLEEVNGDSELEVAVAERIGMLLEDIRIYKEQRQKRQQEPVGAASQ